MKASVIGWRFKDLFPMLFSVTEMVGMSEVFGILGCNLIITTVVRNDCKKNAIFYLTVFLFGISWPYIIKEICAYGRLIPVEINWRQRIPYKRIG